MQSKKIVVYCTILCRVLYKIKEGMYHIEKGYLIKYLRSMLYSDLVNSLNYMAIILVYIPCYVCLHFTIFRAILANGT